MLAPDLRPSELDSLADLIRETSHEAGEIALTYYNQDQEIWEKKGHKGYRSPVSEADLAVDRHLASRLKGAAPEFGWLSEETEDDESRHDRKQVWVVDPIDGTRAFLKGRPHFTICIALLENDVPLLGAVYNPATEEYFHARLGSGAFEDETRLEVCECDTIEECRMIGAKDIFRHKDWPEPWPRSMHVEQRNSMAYRLALVARGDFHATIAFSGKSDWDLAASGLIAQEAGARVTLHNGKPITFNGPQVRHPSVLCAGPRLYDLLFERTKDLPLT